MALGHPDHDEPVVGGEHLAFKCLRRHPASPSAAPGGLGLRFSMLSKHSVEPVPGPFVRLPSIRPPGAIRPMHGQGFRVRHLPSASLGVADALLPCPDKLPPPGLEWAEH